ncbi:trimethylamine methyltransferase family protein [Dongia soli]|uniref:Methyltransferase n=1 Tax=Dongia soli TaxID=600628 RepID=A0ABU5E9C3_9PROT|nr:trimethylamine methyltransferase family protein [Dongia soli]MDY0882928.1 trimethylamine methyltransferase family protein [Dongia soli]
MSREQRVRRERRGGDKGLKQLPWRQYRNPYKPIEVVSDDQLEAIHQASLRILEEMGIEFLDAEAREILKQKGADVVPGSDRVRLDRHMVTEYVAKAPSQFTLHARNPEHNLIFGKDYINFGSVASAPNVSDLDRGRRPGNFDDYADLMRLCQSLNVVQFIGGYPVEPADRPPSTRHLDAHYAAITLTDKIWHPYSLGRYRIEDAIEMICIARGIDKEQLRREPSLFSIVNSNSPLRLDIPMLQGLMAMARHGQPVVLTPFTLSGAMAPATIGGALAQQNAEALAGIAFIQMVNPGTPCVYGGFTSNVDMKTGAPAFGTPEYTRAALVGGQLARKHGLPYRSSNACAANAVDAQAAYESEMSIWGAVMGHANLILHGAGWMEGGLVASFEKMIVDAEIIQHMGEFLQPLEINDDTLGLDAIREVGPGGHFFGCAHTLARYETAFYAPMLSDWRNFENWRLAGALDTAQRANNLWKQVLRDYTPPALDSARDEALQAFVAKRKEEGGVPA